MIKHLIFDLFGTLVRADSSLLGVDPQEFWRHGEKTWMREDVDEKERLEDFAKDHGISYEELCKNFSLLEKSAQMLPGMLGLLKQLKKKKYGLHVLSNAGQTTKKVILSQPAFTVFDTVTCSYEIGAVKPAKEAFRAVLKKVGATPQECVMIGDSLHADVLGAQKIGMLAIHFDAEKHSLDDLRFSLRENSLL